MCRISILLTYTIVILKFQGITHIHTHCIKLIVHKTYKLQNTFTYIQIITNKVVDKNVGKL